jgi:predicted nucleic acid-binding protein
VTTPSASDRIVVDSSGWVEYLGDGPKAPRFAIYLESEAILLLPAIVAYEVHKKVCREQPADVADRFLSQAFSFRERLIPVTLELALFSSKMSLETGLPMADAIIYTTARHEKAQLITSDSHFASLPGVTLI